MIRRSKFNNYNILLS